MMHDIVEEVGEENVVQIVTHNAANYKLDGQILMDKRNKFYWTPCTVHCIDLMLENFESKIPMHKEIIGLSKKITTYIYARTGLITLLHNYTEGGELIRLGITGFVTSYLCLGCLNYKRGGLYEMFNSKQWKDSQFFKTKDGKFVENIVTNKDFWKNPIIFLKGAFPLLKVLSMVDYDEKVAMDYIYETMDHAKEEIQVSYNNKIKSYQPLWKIINNRWDKQLHKPWHVAGYYLNPMLHYKSNFKADNEVKQGMHACLERMMRGDMDMVHTKKRNWLKQKTMNDLLYVMEENAGGNHVNVADLDEDLMQNIGVKSIAHVDEFDVLETIESDNEEGNVDEGDGGGDGDDNYGGGDYEISEDEGVDIMGENSNYRRICDF
ncbi:hypothetical protein KIW84_032493 [Lathyrus oleraceus]|uniref:DUF659 domain-containing protein n=2 Tax=Pisum sativum TaxID=3888 RepID=A0A9D4XVF0_PEA|nr:hypothetical protein KIW84_032493 [Pisum sativum]